MPHVLDPLILDLCEWVARTPRSHAEVMDAWRTSCPRLPVWEDAQERGYLVREHVAGQGTLVRVTPAGLHFLQQHGRAGLATRPPLITSQRA